MENQIFVINQSNLTFVRQSLKQLDGIWVAEIDGNNSDTLENYLQEVSNTFKFPIPAKSLDGYVDWMTDLDWLHAKGYALIIKDFKSFMKNDPEKKEKVLWLFKEDILPFWQSDVEQFVVEGKAKPFHVYLVD